MHPKQRYRQLPVIQRQLPLYQLPVYELISYICRQLLLYQLPVYELI